MHVKGVSLNWFLEQLPQDADDLSAVIIHILILVVFQDFVALQCLVGLQEILRCAALTMSTSSDLLPDLSLRLSFFNFLRRGADVL